MTDIKYAIVQHSGFGYKGDPTFRYGLETRQVSTKREQDRVRLEGGVLFDDYNEAEDFCDDATYNDGTLVPVAKGTFSEKCIDSLRIYIPVRKVVG